MLVPGRDPPQGGRDPPTHPRVPGVMEEVTHHRPLGVQLRVVSILEESRADRTGGSLNRLISHPQSEKLKTLVEPDSVSMVTNFPVDVTSIFSSNG